MTTLTATGQVLGGRYALTRFVAGGSMGEVWEAHDDRMDRTVAVKVLRPEYARDPVAVERFRTEARLAARLADPGIALVHDVDDGSSPDEPPWMVQEYVSGRPLSELVAMTGRLDPFRVAELVAQAAEAVHTAHLAGVVHRDLTPGNLLVSDGDVVKITDFGIARASGLPPLTATGQVLGAAAYLAPEQVRGRPASAASDIYTLGVVLHECLTGARPFSGANPIEVARAHLHQQPPPLPTSVPEPLRATTAAALAKDPADRPGSAAELAARLRAVARLRPASSGPSQAPTPTRPPAPVTSSSRTAPPRRLPPIPQPTPAPIRPPVVAGAAAVRLAARPSTDASAGASSTVPEWWSAAARGARRLWRRYPVTQVGLTGAAVLLLVLLAVLWGWTDANAAPAVDTVGLGAGTVRVVDDAGKGDG